VIGGAFDPLPTYLAEFISSSLTVKVTAWIAPQLIASRPGAGLDGWSFTLHNPSETHAVLPTGNFYALCAVQGS
jgi:hypothetical protein